MEKKGREYPSELKTRWAYKGYTNEVRAKCRDMIKREEEAIISKFNSVIQTCQTPTPVAR